MRGKWKKPLLPFTVWTKRKISSRRARSSGVASQATRPPDKASSISRVSAMNSLRRSSMAPPLVTDLYEGLWLRRSLLAGVGLSWKSAEYSIAIDRVRKLFEIHVADRQIVFDAPHLARDDAEAARRSPQRDAQHRTFSVRHRDAVGDEEDGVARRLRHE